VTNQTPDEILSTLNESFYDGFDEYLNKNEDLKKEFNEKMQYNSEQIKKYIKRNKLSIPWKDIKNISRKFSYLNSKVFKENDNSLDFITIVEKVAKNYFWDYIYNLYKEQKYIIDITILDEFDKRKNAEDILRTCYNREKFWKKFITLEFNKLNKILQMSSVYFLVVRMHEFGHIFEKLIFSNEQHYKDNGIIVLQDKLLKAKNYNFELYSVLKEGFAEDFSYFWFRFIYENYMFDWNKEDNLENKELIFLAQRLLSHNVVKLSKDKKKKESYKKSLYWYSYWPSMMFFLRKTFWLNLFQTKIFWYLSCLWNDSIIFDEFIDYIENEIKSNNLLKYNINEKIDELLFLLNTWKEI